MVSVGGRRDLLVGCLLSGERPDCFFYHAFAFYFRGGAGSGWPPTIFLRSRWTS